MRFVFKDNFGHVSKNESVEEEYESSLTGVLFVVSDSDLHLSSFDDPSVDDFKVECDLLSISSFVIL